MKIGTLCYATKQGLGYLAKSFYDNGIVTNPMIVAHGSRQSFNREWYPGAPVLSNFKTDSTLKEFCKSVDVMLFFETPFHWPIIDFCGWNEVKTVLMPMHECMPNQWPHQPDAILNPSPLEQRCYPTGKFIPVPVDKSSWTRRDIAKVFVHNAGHGGLRGRNGTHELYTALQYVKSPIKLILRAQDHICPELPTHSTTITIGNVTVDYRYGTCKKHELYSEGDVFVFPEKFNGLSLPLQEAKASGIAVMTTQRFPNTEYLGDFFPIPVGHHEKARIGQRFQWFDEAVVTPRDIARSIDAAYNTDVSAMSVQGLQWSKDHSWDNLKPLYREFFNGLV